jgi:hypothetical protein
MVFNLIVYGFVVLIVGAFAWLIIKPKDPANPMPQPLQPAPIPPHPMPPQPISPTVPYTRLQTDSEMDRKLLRIQRILQQKYEAKADSAAIAEAYELLGEE